jgi:hypothetical protein
MKPAVGFLVLTAALFLGWIGWLAYLVATARPPVVLSRPQFLASTVDVIGWVDARPDGRPNPEVRVREVHWPPEGPEKGLTDTTITVHDLPERAEEGWTGPNFYILPLVKDGKDYRVARIPRSPGFEADTQGGRPRIYQETSQTHCQLEEVRKPEGSQAGD